VNITLKHWDAAEVVFRSARRTADADFEGLRKDLISAMHERRWMVVLNAHVAPDLVGSVLASDTALTHIAKPIIPFNQGMLSI
jgi:hypothetical protein